MKSPSPVFLVGLLFAFAVIGVSCAQIGEVAGPLNFNVSIGSRQSLTFTLANGGSTAFEFNVTPFITTDIPNTIAPTIIITPMNGTISPHRLFPLNVTVYMHSGEKNAPGMTWNGYLSAIMVSNVSVTNGAVIQAGALKIMTITAAPAKFNLLYAVLEVLACVVVIVGIYYAVSKRRAKGKAKKSAKAMKAAKKATKRTARKGRKNARGKKKGTSRKISARGARRGRAARR
jgi:hypothetical protein